MSGVVAQNSARHSGLIKSASAGGTWNLILTQTASDSSTISFTSGIDSTYAEYVFKFYNINPANQYGRFWFQVSIDGGSNYTNGNITSTFFLARHLENDGEETFLIYDTAYDQAAGVEAGAYTYTGQALTHSQSYDADGSMSGTLRLYNPSSTTFIKHFMSSTSYMQYSPRAYTTFAGGYINDTNDVDAIRFGMGYYDVGSANFPDGNFDGQISLYGIS